MFLAAFVLLFAAGATIVSAQAASPASATNSIQIVLIQGSVTVLPANGATWEPARINQPLHASDRIHTAGDSRVAVRWSDQSIISFGASTELEILPAETTDAEAGLRLLRGVASFFHRDKPGQIRIITRGAMAGVEGTEFVLAVNEADRTTLSVIDGRVRLGNDQGTLVLTNTEQAAVAVGQAPVRIPGFIANNLLQWCFYYPAVIDPDELPLTMDETNALAGSLAAYRDGDLPAALAQFPLDHPATDSDHLYYAALLLSVGNVAETEATLASITNHSERFERLAGALRQLIAAVKRQPAATTAEPQLASEFLAASYFEQSQAIREISLQKALRLAQAATRVSPNFGFAWERVAELEFGFGRTDAALAALNQSLRLAPRNAQALALKGFVLARQNQPQEALQWFDRALAADSALGNAWLGRGLVRIHLGDPKGGREDLLVAAALEPQRAELRSYLGKAYTAAGDDAHAAKELALAKKLDPNDPTAWLYSALLNQQGNQINDAIRDLEKSQALNDNRSVYRSQLLLDQDSAVRSANLANIYQDAGMYDTAVNEAGRAVSSDYGNYSAHLFLAGSYEQLRSPDWSSLRYDTPTSDEFWIANLLAPTSAGWLSPTIAEQPYARLFEQDHIGLVSDTTYLSRGAWQQNADAFYTSDKLAFDFGTSYISDPGQRPNEDFEQTEYDISLKGQLTPKDSLFGAIQLVSVNAGDVNEYYNQSAASPGYQSSETQQPNVFVGYHHEWSPGAQTLFLASRQVADDSLSNTNGSQNVAVNSGGAFTGTQPFKYDNQSVGLNMEEYSVELQQIWEQDNHTTIIGSRYDWGNVSYANSELLSGNFANLFSKDPNYLFNQNFALDYSHYNIYGYHTWQIFDPLSLTAGLSYDWLRQPVDPVSTPFVDPHAAGSDYPLAQQEGVLNGQYATKSQLSPKVGFIWTPDATTVLRAAYTRSLSDFGSAQNDQLEPTEVAGFNQAYRSLIPESAAGIADTSGSCFDTFDVSLEQKFPTETYLILSAQALYSKLSDTQGNFVYLYDSGLDYSTYPLGLQQSLNYRERSVALEVNQLLGRDWTVGAKYDLSQANLSVGCNQLPGNPQYNQSLESLLQTVALHANWNHPSGLFSILECNWYHQDPSGFSPTESGDDFWQLNAYAGYRMWHRKVEISVGLLNLTDQNYQLEPLNLYNEMARSRTFTARLLISF